MPRKPRGAFTQITRMDILFPSYFLTSINPSRISAAPTSASHAQQGTHSRITSTPAPISTYPAIRRSKLLPLG